MCVNGRLFSCLAWPTWPFLLQDTSRPPQDGEVDGKDYHFISHNAFQSAIDAHKFVEYGMHQKDFYGTSIDAIRNVTEAGKVCVLNLHCQVIRCIDWCLCSMPMIDASTRCLCSMPMLYASAWCLCSMPLAVTACSGITTWQNFLFSIQDNWLQRKPIEAITIARSILLLFFLRHYRSWRTPTCDHTWSL